MPIPSQIKQPAESRLYSMDFAALLGKGETLSSVTSVVADRPGLTLGTPVAAGTLASVQISGGTSGGSYKVTFLVATSGGNTLQGEGILQVIDL